MYTYMHCAVGLKQSTFWCLKGSVSYLGGPGLGSTSSAWLDKCLSQWHPRLLRLKETMRFHERTEKFLQVMQLRFRDGKGVARGGAARWWQNGASNLIQGLGSRPGRRHHTSGGSSQTGAGTPSILPEVRSLVGDGGLKHLPKDKLKRPCTDGVGCREWVGGTGKSEELGRGIRGSLGRGAGRL